jgi:hypothetical protein
LRRVGVKSIAYRDESGGTDANGKTFILGGFVASEDALPSFWRDWGHTRALPPISRHFHMADISWPATANGRVTRSSADVRAAPTQPL